MPLSGWRVVRYLDLKRFRQDYGSNFEGVVEVYSSILRTRERD